MEKMKLKTKRHKGVKRRKYQYQTIDGNWTFYHLAVCTYYKGVLTRGLMRTHKCNGCFRLDREVYFE